jgi:hypothetical protein
MLAIILAAGVSAPFIDGIHLGDSLAGIEARLGTPQQALLGTSPALCWRRGNGVKLSVVVDSDRNVTMIDALAQRGASGTVTLPGTTSAIGDGFVYEKRTLQPAGADGVARCASRFGGNCFAFVYPFEMVMRVDYSGIGSAGVDWTLREVTLASAGNLQAFGFQ